MKSGCNFDVLEVWRSEKNPCSTAQGGKVKSHAQMVKQVQKKQQKGGRRRSKSILELVS